MKKKMKKILNKDDLHLLKMAKQKNQEAIKEVITKYGGIYDSIVCRVNFKNNYTKQDMIDEKPTFFFNMIETYNPNKNAKFSTYVYNMSKWACLDRLKKDRKELEFLSEEIYEEQFDISKISHIINKIKTFDDRAQYIFMNRFFDDKKTFQEIGEKLNMTYEGVRQIYLKHLKILKKEYET